MAKLSELHLETDASGDRTLRLVSTDTKILDHAWLQRDAYIRFGEGATTFEVLLVSETGQEIVSTRYQPDLPVDLGL